MVTLKEFIQKTLRELKSQSGGRFRWFRKDSGEAPIPFEKWAEAWGLVWNEEIDWDAGRIGRDYPKGFKGQEPKEGREVWELNPRSPLIWTTPSVSFEKETKFLPQSDWLSVHLLGLAESPPDPYPKARIDIPFHPRGDE